MGKYAIGFKMQYDEELVYDFFLGVGEAINKTGQEVLNRKVSMKIKRNKYVVIKIKVKLEYGTVLRFKHVEPISFFAKLVSVPPQGMGGDQMQMLQEQMEAMGLGGMMPMGEEPAKNKIGFDVEGD